MNLRHTRYPRRFLRGMLSGLQCLFLLAGWVACAVPPALTPAPADTATPGISSSPTPSATAATITPSVTPTFTPSPPPRPSVRRVLIVSFDGLRPDGLLRAQIPVISRAINAGASMFSAQSVYPPSTLPAHSSMLSGRCVANHGINWNDYIPANGYLQGPTVFSVAHDAGLRTVMVVGKEKLLTIACPGTVDSFRYISTSDEQTVQVALTEAEAGFGVLFVHFWLPDYVGHLDGWMSPPYIRIIGRDDIALGTLLDGLQTRGLMDGTLVILTADHGGHDYSHGTAIKEDMTIPWIAYGPGVVPGTSLTVPVSTTDTAATAVWALGLNLPAGWDGRPVVEAFGLSAEQAGVAEASPDRCLP
jgi:hypothetical protein